METDEKAVGQNEEPPETRPWVPRWLRFSLIVAGVVLLGLILMPAMSARPLRIKRTTTGVYTTHIVHVGDPLEHAYDIILDAGATDFSRLVGIKMAMPYHA